jgi:hypothetical protein
VVCQRGACTVREESARYGGGRTPFGINLAAGAVVMIAAAFVAVLFPEVNARLAVVVAVVGGYAGVVADAGASLATAGLGYLVFDGFLLNRLGELTWNGMTNVWHLINFALAVGAGLAWRLIRAIRADLAPAREAAGLAGAADPQVIDKKEALRG